MKPHILIGIPTMGNIHAMLVVVITSWIAEAHKTGEYNLSFYPTLGVQPVDNARNEIVEEFLKSTATHLLFIDSDTIPPLNALKRLLGHDKEIVSALTPIIEYDALRFNDSSGFYKKWNAVTMEEKFTEPHKGLIEIKGCGAACILIKREVFEKMPKPWYRFLYTDDNGKDIFMGEDTHFIVKAISMGIKSYADTSLICGHSKTIIWR